MDPMDRLRPWTPRLLFLAVVAILILVGVIQYQWFSRSAAVEIEGSIRGLELTVRQTVTREFQRFAPVAAEFDRLGSGSAPGPREAEALLDRLWTAYGPDGTAPRLLVWVGWMEPSRGVVHRRDGAGPWVEGPLPPDRWAQTAAKAPPDKGIQSADVVIYRPSDSPDAPVLLLGLDIDGFFETYVHPAMADQFPGAALRWDQGPQEPPPPGAGFNSRNYAFNPFTALVAGASVPPDLEVGIPRGIELPWKSGARPGPDPFGPGFHGQGSWTLRVTLPSDAPVLAVEGRLAWNWLGSTLLLLVLAAAFALVLGQWDRVGTLRVREREFVASVSHELRTPLTVIRSAADNFTRGIVPAERQGQYGRLILDQSLRLGRMIEEMLAFAQTEGAAPARVEAPVVFGPWLAELRPPLEALAAARQVTLVWDVAGVPPSGRSDPEGLRLILENLVVNAVNHAYPPPGPGTGTRTVRLTLKHLVPDRLELSVDDEGRGISPKEAKKVFEPFYRDQVSRDNQEKGSGLGLFLAQRQARRLGGDLRLESPWRRPDGIRRPGCRFVLRVPFRPEEEVTHGR